MASRLLRFAIAVLRALRPVALTILAGVAASPGKVRICRIELGPRETSALHAVGIIGPALGMLFFQSCFAFRGMSTTKAFDFLKSLVLHEEPSITNEHINPMPDIDTVKPVMPKRSRVIASAMVATE